MDITKKIEFIVERYPIRPQTQEWEPPKTTTLDDLINSLWDKIK